jgi:hypothetical protein
MNTKSIFIPIAACEEKFIKQTIQSALSAAKNPSEIYFGVFNNILDKKNSLLDDEFMTKNDQIFYTEILSPIPLGVGFGRANASLLQFYSFDYMFQIDAHTIFTKDWDEKIISVFNKIKDENQIDEDKLVLSSICPISWTYNPNNIEEILMPDFIKNTFVKVDPYNLEESYPLINTKDLTIPEIVYNGRQGDITIDAYVDFPIVYGKHGGRGEKDYEETNCVHASFVFSKANIIREILHDALDPFNGDQSNYSIRLLSRGYKIFSPKAPLISTLNKFKIEQIDNNFKNTDIFLDQDDWRVARVTSQRDNCYINYLNNNAHLFFNKMITGKYFGYWGAPDQKSLDEAKKKINYPESL